VFAEELPKIAEGLMLFGIRDDPLFPESGGFDPAVLVLP
jgi:hypothetical protein